ncbi:hypothetical protein VMUT_1910 [Vulcanisaeta moutnovskia 768-28]|uniref:Uncharacterized protein n=1 Tax=Vulcanisaeta moutnovskia (strain 768-28) TaxID=985053 RepID=F0QVT7_VULM7|nr:hypothetical protein [Vulcanisaeta moutnovskia]ADY02111.1 hypothetical protein VMUT_1910 [Vulcanisaeta moutnovskia 768-28]
MAEKFDRYYEYFVNRTRAGLKPRRIRLGLISIDLDRRVTELRFIPGRVKTRQVVIESNVVEGDQIDLVSPPEGVRVIKGKRVKVQDAILEAVEGEDVTLINVDVKRVIGRYVRVVNCDVGHVEGEEVTMVNAVANEVIVKRGEFMNCDVGRLIYEEFYRAMNTDIKSVSRK